MTDFPTERIREIYGLDDDEWAEVLRRVEERREVDEWMAQRHRAYLKWVGETLTRILKNSSSTDGCE
jgi:predicted branched-subunit amino acid permease